ncbi:hypothetical protein BU26DRAFT_272027 [Trematosphaeria pertusa]|uniref:Uncharacterized protein n=1 Tax=Trematosphaeria pertusa TaxID=390896 RepID=A0A6A6ILC7_9PLEO|nr:uncharacterized protein BU26DRAFT_272027 [Trematosphaeria pertusa]KAF2250868.1 hypothetical protein BU26DRAFT_272027 [Trematosphaeria pertusa]
MVSLISSLPHHVHLYLNYSTPEYERTRLREDVLSLSRIPSQHAYYKAAPEAACFPLLFIRARTARPQLPTCNTEAPEHPLESTHPNELLFHPSTVPAVSRGSSLQQSKHNNMPLKLFSKFTTSKNAEKAPKTPNEHTTSTMYRPSGGITTMPETEINAEAEAMKHTRQKSSLRHATVPSAPTPEATAAAPTIVQKPETPDQNRSISAPVTASSTAPTTPNQSESSRTTPSTAPTTPTSWDTLPRSIQYRPRGVFSARPDVVPVDAAGKEKKHGRFCKIKTAIKNKFVRGKKTDTGHRQGQCCKHKKFRDGRCKKCSAMKGEVEGLLEAGAHCAHGGCAGCEECVDGIEMTLAPFHAPQLDAFRPISDFIVDFPNLGAVEDTTTDEPNTGEVEIPPVSDEPPKIAELRPIPDLVDPFGEFVTVPDASTVDENSPTSSHFTQGTLPTEVTRPSTAATGNAAPEIPPNPAVTSDLSEAENQRTPCPDRSRAKTQESSDDQDGDEHFSDADPDFKVTPSLKGKLYDGDGDWTVYEENAVARAVTITKVRAREVTIAPRRRGRHHRHRRVQVTEEQSVELQDEVEEDMLVRTGEAAIRRRRCSRVQMASITEAWSIQEQQQDEAQKDMPVQTREVTIHLRRLSSMKTAPATEEQPNEEPQDKAKEETPVKAGEVTIPPRRRSSVQTAPATEEHPNEEQQEEETTEQSTEDWENQIYRLEAEAAQRRPPRIIYYPPTALQAAAGISRQRLNIWRALLPPMDHLIPPGLLRDFATGQKKKLWMQNPKTFYSPISLGAVVAHQRRLAAKAKGVQVSSRLLADVVKYPRLAGEGPHLPSGSNVEEMRPVIKLPENVVELIVTSALAGSHKCQATLDAMHSLLLPSRALWTRRGRCPIRCAYCVIELWLLVYCNHATQAIAEAVQKQFFPKAGEKTMKRAAFSKFINERARKGDLRENVAAKVQALIWAYGNVAPLLRPTGEIQVQEIGNWLVELHQDTVLVEDLSMTEVEEEETPGTFAQEILDDMTDPEGDQQAPEPTPILQPAALHRSASSIDLDAGTIEESQTPKRRNTLPRTRRDSLSLLKMRADPCTNAEADIKESPAEASEEHTRTREPPTTSLKDSAQDLSTIQDGDTDVQHPDRANALMSLHRLAKHLHRRGGRRRLDSDPDSDTDSPSIEKVGEEVPNTITKLRRKPSHFLTRLIQRVQDTAKKQEDDTVSVASLD